MFIDVAKNNQEYLIFIARYIFESASSIYTLIFSLPLKFLGFSIYRWRKSRDPRIVHQNESQPDNKIQLQYTKHFARCLGEDLKYDIRAVVLTPGYILS